MYVSYILKRINDPRNADTRLYPFLPIFDIKEILLRFYIFRIFIKGRNTWKKISIRHVLLVLEEDLKKNLTCFYKK